MVSGLMASLSERMEEGVEVGDDSEEAIIRNAAGSAFGGGADTVSMANLFASTHHNDNSRRIADTFNS